MKCKQFNLPSPFHFSPFSVTQYSDENMMQPYNLAVCFGPSLVRGEQDDDVVALQPLINALVKSIILQHESVFPSQTEVQGPVYEKCMTLEQDDWYVDVFDAADSRTCITNMCGCLSFSEAIVEEGEAEAEYSYCKDGENFFRQK